MARDHIPILSISLPALRANYRLLKGRHAQKKIAAVVKANAYGLGVEGVSRALWQEGCRQFFVATLAEGIELRQILPEAEIAVFEGLLAGEEKEFQEHRLTPVLNMVEQVERFMKLQVASCKLQAILHVDTGMTRLGLSQSDLSRLQLATCNLQLIMSHLACANEPEHPKNTEQLQRFKAALALFPGAKASLCNSSGLFLPKDFHFDLGRPGCALYGINPTEGKNPLQPVATLSAPILQIRTLDRDETVGYGATHHASHGSRVAIVALGYADGWMRLLSNKGFAYIGGEKLPILGRVSMDMIAIDVSSLPESRLASDARAEFLNQQQTVDDIARICGTIGYEIFTRIGERVKRVYA